MNNSLLKDNDKCGLMPARHWRNASVAPVLNASMNGNRRVEKAKILHRIAKTAMHEQLNTIDKVIKSCYSEKKHSIMKISLFIK